MSSRLIAFLILALLVVLPVTWYTYFIETNTVHITFSSDSSIPFSLSMKGKFSMKYLPIADTLIDRTYTCEGICTISEIPPASYDITATSTGYQNLQMKLDISTGESSTHQFIFHRKLSVREIAPPRSDQSELEIRGILDLLREGNPSSQIELIRAIGTTVWATVQEGSDIGVWRIEKNRPLRVMTFSLRSASWYLDIPELHYIISSSQISTQSIDLEDGKISTLPTLSEKILSLSSNPEGMIIQTGSGSRLIWEDGKSVMNPRFTDWIDLDDQYRVGYISPSDFSRLALGNLPPERGVLLLLDRSTAEIQTIDPSIEIQSFFSLQKGEKGYIDRAGKWWQLTW